MKPKSKTKMKMKRRLKIRKGDQDIQDQMKVSSNAMIQMFANAKSKPKLNALSGIWKRKTGLDKSASKSKGKSKTQLKWATAVASSTKQIHKDDAPTEEWIKLKKWINKTRKEAQYKSQRSRKIIKSITELEYVPDPLTKKPADYYIQIRPLPYELRFNPFSLVFAEGSVPMSKIPDMIFYTLNFLQAPIASLFMFSGLYCFGYTKSIQSLQPEDSKNYPAFATTVVSVLDDYDLSGLGMGMMGISSSLCLLVLLSCLSVYQGRSKALVLTTLGMLGILFAEWYFAFVFVNRSPCNKLQGLRGVIQYHLDQYWTHLHTHNRFGPHVVINNMQRYLGCCGNAGPKDYEIIPRNVKRVPHPVPPSCCAVLWSQNVFCSSVTPLDKSNPDYLNRINQRGCYASLIKVCNLIMWASPELKYMHYMVQTDWLRIGAIVHSLLFILILASVFLELSLLKTMFLSCEKIEFALRSYVIPDEPMIRKKTHGFSGLDMNEDLSAGSGLTLEAAFLPREMQDRIDVVREEYGIGKEKFGLEIDELIRAELKVEAENFVANMQQQRRKSKHNIVIQGPNLTFTQNRAFFASGRYKFLLPINRDTHKLLPQILKKNKNHMLANLDKMEKDPDKTTSNQDLVNPDVDDKDIVGYKKRLAATLAKEKGIGKQSKWMWRHRRHESITSIPSNDMISGGVRKGLSDTEQRSVDQKQQQINKVKQAVGRGQTRKKMAPRSSIIDPEEIFRRENATQIEQIKEEMKVLVDEPSKTRKYFLEHLALQKIEQIKNQEEGGGRKIVILEDRLLTQGQAKARRQSFDISQFETQQVISAHKASIPPGSQADEDAEKLKNSTENK